MIVQIEALPLSNFVPVWSAVLRDGGIAAFLLGDLLATL